MNQIEEGKLYKLEGRGMIRHYAEAIVLLFLLGSLLWLTVNTFIKHGLVLFTFKDYAIFKTSFMLLSSGFIIWHFYCSLFYCNHGIITRETVIGLNGYRVKRGEIRFGEIEEIRSYGKGVSLILIKDKHENKLILATSIQPTEDFFNEIIRRATNCKKIDLEAKRKDFPNLLIYRKG